MKIKNIYKIVCMIALIAVLAACGATEVTTRTFEKSDSGMKSVLTYKAKKDKVVEQSAVTTTTYEYIGLTKEQVEEAFAPIIKSYQDLKGVTYTAAFKETEVTENLMINYEEVDISKLRKLEGMTVEGSEDIKVVSMKQSEELLKSQGYTEKK